MALLSFKFIFKRVIFVLALLLSVSFAENEITSFIGGNHYFNVRLNTNILTGTNARIASFGNSPSSMLASPAMIGNNPASIGYLKNNSFELEFLPPVMMNIGNLYGGFQDKINTTVDDAIADMKSADLQPVYPGVEMITGQPAKINSLSMIWNLNRYGNFGISYNNLFDLNLNGVINGLSFQASDISIVEEGGDSHEEKTIVPLAVEALINMKMKYHTANFVWGKRFLDDQYSIGIGINVLAADIDISEETLIDGIIRQTGGSADITAVFNDPSADYRNSMNIEMESGFSKKMIRPKLGVSYHPAENFYFDMSIITKSRMLMDGALEISQHNLGALNINYDEAAGEEMFDFNQLKPSQITYTNKTVYTSDYLVFEYPGSVGLSIGYRKNWFAGIFAYEKSIGEFSLHYKCDVFEDGQKKVGNKFVFYADTTQKDYKIIHNPNHTLKFGVGFGIFSMGGQIILGDILFDGLTNNEGEPLENIMGTVIGGSFSTNLRFKLGENINCDLGLISMPGPFLRTNIAYTF